MISKNYEKTLLNRNASQRHAYIYGIDNKGDVRQTTVLGKEHEFAQNVKEAVRATYAIARSKKPVFSLISDRFRPGRMIRPTADGERLMQAMQLPFADIQATLPNHHMNPLFGLLQQQCELHHAEDLLTSNIGVMSEAAARTTLSRLEALVNGIRQGWVSKEVQKSFDSARRRSDKRWKSLKKAVRESFEDCTKLLPVRLDLHFHASAVDYPIAPSVSEKEAYGYLVKFERYLRDHHPLVRYICNMEYGTETGFHFHTLILVNGHVAQRGALIAKQMGEQWERVITEGKGRYFNCNAVRNTKPALEVIHYSDFVRVEALLNEAAWYLAKTDIWMRYQASGKSFVISRRYMQPYRGGAKRKRRTKAEEKMRRA